MVVILNCDLNLLLGFALTEVITSRHDACRSVTPLAMRFNDVLNHVTERRFELHRAQLAAL